MPTSAVSTFRTLAMPVLLLLLLGQGTAHADKVDQLIGQLTTSSDYKVRLSAALSLVKLDDPRAIPAFIKSLRDKDKNVRGVSATSLAKLIGRETNARLRKQALAALENAGRRDKEDFVRRQAKKAYMQIKKLDTPAGGGIYVNIGDMSAKTKAAEKMRSLMRQTAEQTISKRAGAMMTSWPSGKEPSKKQLSEAKTSAYHVDGTLISLEAESKGSTTLVSCKISMLIATFPEKSMFGFLDGGARVQTGSSPQDIEYAQEDCVAAVVEDLMAKKIIPVIQQRQ